MNSASVPSCGPLAGGSDAAAGLSFPYALVSSPGASRRPAYTSPGAGRRPLSSWHMKKGKAAQTQIAEAVASLEHAAPFSLTVGA